MVLHPQALYTLKYPCCVHIAVLGLVFVLLLPVPAEVGCNTVISTAFININLEI